MSRTDIPGWDPLVALYDKWLVCDTCDMPNCEGHVESGAPIRFALAIPTCADWRPERQASLDRLLDALMVGGPQPVVVKQFRDREPNWVWSRRMWDWAAEQDATHLVQLQDDVRPMPDFWAVLHAMVQGNPDQWIGLHVNHPVAQNLAHVGRRWFRTRAWFVGPQWVAPLDGQNALANMLAWRDANAKLQDGDPEKMTQFELEHEDVGIGTWLAKTGRDVYHPIPAIADVDLTIESSYEGVEGHIDDHRRPRVTWHGYRAAMLKDPAYWTLPSKTELYPGPGSGMCSFCGSEPAQYKGANFIGIGRMCRFQMMAADLGVPIQRDGGVR